MKRMLLIVVLASLFSCKQGGETNAPVVTGLLGKSFYEPERTPENQARLEKDLAEAKAKWKDDPSEENFIWYGRRLGYLSRFQEAIDIYSKGIEKFPKSGKLYRHRGHRNISMRRFDAAVEDLKKATSLTSQFEPEIEPDGQPNKINTPLSTTQFNIAYHLGLAYYLKGDFENAQLAYIDCLNFCANDDLLIATIDWLYMTYKRQRVDVGANAILANATDTMKIVENDSYYRRCRMYQGKIPADSLLQASAGDDDVDLVLATQGYGVGNWYLYNGDSVKAKATFERVVAGKHFSAFGFIASEVELARWK